MLKTAETSGDCACGIRGPHCISCCTTQQLIASLSQHQTMIALLKAVFNFETMIGQVVMALYSGPSRVVAGLCLAVTPLNLK